MHACSRDLGPSRGPCEPGHPHRRLTHGSHMGSCLVWAVRTESTPGQCRCVRGAVDAADGVSRHTVIHTWTLTARTSYGDNHVAAAQPPLTVPRAGLPLQVWLCESIAVLVSPTLTCHTTHLTRTPTYTNMHSHTRLLTQIARTHILTHTLLAHSTAPPRSPRPPHLFMVGAPKQGHFLCVILWGDFHGS